MPATLKRRGAKAVHLFNLHHKYTLFLCSFDAAKGLDTILPYLESDMSIIAAKATLILVETVKEEDYKRVKDVDDIGKAILRRLLEPAICKSSHR